MLQKSAWLRDIQSDQPQWLSLELFIICLTDRRCLTALAP